MKLYTTNKEVLGGATTLAYYVLEANPDDIGLLYRAVAEFSVSPIGDYDVAWVGQQRRQHAVAVSNQILQAILMGDVLPVVRLQATVRVGCPKPKTGVNRKRNRISFSRNTRTRI